MATITLDNVNKVYSNGFHAVHNLSMDIGEGVARVDPSAKVTVGEKITFAVNATGMQFFDPGSGAAIWQ